MENDYTAGGHFPKQRQQPCGMCGSRSWPHTVPGALQQHQESLMDGGICTPALFLAATLHLLLALEKGKIPMEHHGCCSL